jgi:preprotein translocase subunit YajC
MDWLSIGMLVLVVVFFYFFLIRPQKKQEKQAQDMRNSLEIGDEIVTIGGIVGQVINIKEDTITIVTSKDRTKIRFLKTAIREVTVKANAPAEPAPASEAPALKEDKKPEKKTKAKAEKAAEASAEDTQSAE